MHEAIGRFLRAGVAVVPALSGIPCALAQDTPPDTPLEEIVVTGSRIQQRLEDVPRPVVLVNRDDIERSAQDSVGKVLQQLPGVTGSPSNTNVNNGGDGSTRVDLRGLGAERSLVLVNGRRFVYGGLGGDTAVDLNMIPSSMIERIEVLGVGSSTVYGADAVGGVVNIITRKDFSGLDVGGTYALSSRKDGDVSTVHFVAGQAFDRGYFAFGGDAVNQAEVFQAARDYSSNAEYIQADGSIGTSGSPTTPQGYFGVPAGNTLGLPRSLPPRGGYTRVTGSGGPGTAADFRLFLSPQDFYNYAPYNYLQTPSERQSIWLQAGYDLTDDVSFFVEGLLHHRSSEQLLAPTPYATRVDFEATPCLATPCLDDSPHGIPASNYYNPFGVDILFLRRRFAETGGRRYTQDVDTKRFVAGLDGKLGASWNWELSLTYGRNETAQTTNGEFRTDRMRLALGPSGPDASGNIVCGERDPATGLVPAQNVIPGCVPLNLFGGMGPDGRGTITREQLDYVTAPLHDEGYNEQRVYDLVFRGDWGAIGAQPIHWAVGATRREETAANKPDPAKLAGVAGALVTSLANGGEFSVNELYAENVIPLLHGAPAAEDLNLTLGARYSDFSSFGSVTNYQGGVLYRPIRDLTLRAGYGRVFRAPPIVNLFQSTSPTTGTDRDPCGNDPTPAQRVNCAANGVPGGGYVQDENDSYRTVVGGNPELQPEKGDSTSAGLTLTPRAVDGLRISVDWWRTALDDVIYLPAGSQPFLDTCANYGLAAACDKIQRNADGTIRRVDARYVNAASLKVEGYDFDVGYTVPAGPGQLDSRLMTTYLVAADQQTFKGGDTRHFAGSRSDFTAYPRWRGLGYLAYTIHGWSASYQLQYIGAMNECGTPDADTFGTFQGCRRIDDVWYQDLNVGYEFDTGLQVTVAVDNLADVQPPRVNFNADANTDTATYRLLGRTFYLALNYRLR